MKKNSEAKRQRVPTRVKTEGAEEALASGTKLIRLAGRLSEGTTKRRASRLDLSGLIRLREMKEFTEKFLGNQLPSVFECGDEVRFAFKRASALLDLCDSAAEFDNGNARPEVIEGWIMDSAHLQLEMLYVAAQRLEEICNLESAARPEK